MIAAVFVSPSTREFDRIYHYLVPDRMSSLIMPGMRVIIPFGRANRPVEGFVFELLEASGLDSLKKIGKLLDEKPVLSPEMLKLAVFMKERYICTFSDAARTMLPPGIGIKSLRVVRLLKDSIDGCKPGKSQRIILDTLIEAGGEAEYEVLKARTGLKGFTQGLNALVKAGFAAIAEEYSTRAREKTVRAAYITRPREEIVEEIETNRIKRIQQIRVLEMLLDSEYITVPDIIRFAAVSAGVLDTLKKNGYLDYRDIEITRDPVRPGSYTRTEPLNPTPEQKQILDNVKEKLDTGGFSEILLHGVTGSGKTEVYLQLIQHCIAREREAIVLVPEISLTPQMVERFKGRFGERVAVLHSRLSLGERYDQWRLIREGTIKVVVGARSAVFAPLSNPGIIIIDEEHENTYKSEVTPKYNAKDIARERCNMNNAVLLLGSATPSTEAYYRAVNGTTELLAMSGRTNRQEMPEVTLVDMRNELDNGNRSIFSTRLSAWIRENIENRRQTILFLNRRGHSSFVLCRKCGFTMKCTNCSINLTYHARDERLICHYCGFTVKNPEVCPACGSNYIRHFGIGTQKVEEDIKKHFNGCSAIRMDMDTTTGKNSHEEILTAFREENINILIGTQMIAKGHDFPNVTLVGVLAADSLLNTGDYMAAERTFQLITQVAGRAGRGELPGRVVVQAYNTEDFSIRAACQHDYQSFYSQEILLRKALNYPPFTNIALVMLSGYNDRFVSETAGKVAGKIEEYFKGWDMPYDVFGPARPPLIRIKGRYRWRIVIKSKDLDKLIKVLTSISDEWYGKKADSNVDLSVDINPANML